MYGLACGSDRRVYTYGRVTFKISSLHPARERQSKSKNGVGLEGVSGQGEGPQMGLGLGMLYLIVCLVTRDFGRSRMATLE